VHRSKLNSRRPSLTSAFTLLELLVVIGIIALLISILLPALGRAREAANQTKCLSNLRNLGSAFMAYVNDNKGTFPASAVAGSTLTYDFIYWDQARFPQIATAGIAPYLNITPTNYAIMLCPSDDPTYRFRGGSNPYPFSYTMNWMTTSFSVANDVMPNGKFYPKITDVPHTSQTIMILEEDQNTIDDGQSSIWLQAGCWGLVNLLAIRHDRARSNPDNPATGLLVNGNCRGNVAFCDGHAEFVSRWFCASKSNAVPVPSDFPNDPETEPPGP
jgi:prepilin-type processing-associated H-X9-DG protein/prepilin-type N-terminal cleavage/methylation domain-containing protein